MAFRSNEARSKANAKKNSRPLRATQSGRIASKQTAKAFSQERYGRSKQVPADAFGAPSDGFRAAYSAGSQGPAASKAFSKQAGNASGGGFVGSSSGASSGGQYSRNNPEYANTTKKRSKKIMRRVAIGAVSVFLLVALGIGVAYAFYVGPINKALAGDKSEEEIQAIAEATVPVQSYTEAFYMILVGSDARAGDSSMGQRSDTNILMRIDPSEAVITMVSIPRDTKVDIDNYGTDKFNAAYGYGGIASTIKEASQLCGVDISCYAEIDFNGLISLVDRIGGVEVDVPELISDPDAGNVVIQQGLQTLNGEAALVFARSRAYADGDFTRTSNQRLLIEAIMKKILSMSITDIPGVIQQAIVEDKIVTTNLKAEDLIGMALQFRDMGTTTIYSAMVPSTTATISAISYVIADTANLAEMMKLVEAGKDPATLVPVTPNYGYIPPQDYSSPGTSNEASGNTYTPPATEQTVPDNSSGGSGGSSENPGDSGGGETPGSGGSGETPVDPPTTSDPTSGEEAAA